MNMEKKSLQSQNKKERNALRFRLLIIVLSLVMINVIAAFVYKRFDLTTEKRYSLSDATIKLLKQNKKNIYIKVYLEGDLESGFLRLKNSTKDILQEMKSASGGSFSYDFINPLPSTATEEQKFAIYQELAGMGLQPTNLKVRKEDQYEERIIFPSLLVSVGENTLPVQILENQIGYSPEEALNHSAISMEYKIANAIKKLSYNDIYNVSFLQGHGEYPPAYVFDFTNKLKESRYNVSFNAIGKGFISNTGDTIMPWNYKTCDLLIVARPVAPFSEFEKFQIDQFIMRGGKVMWLLDGMDADNGYLQNPELLFMAKSHSLNLDEQLFKYGVRINKNLVQDGQQSAPIPVIDNKTDEPMLFPWLYSPLLSPSNAHAIGKNLDPVLSNYCSSVDTIAENGITKTIILSTSQYGRALPEPVRVHLAAIKEKQDFRFFKQPFIPAGVLLEGKFTSLYKNRMEVDFVKKLQEIGISPIENGKNTKMIVFGDADIIKNHVSQKGEQYPLGYEIYSKQVFANMDFLKNCVEYLTDTNGLLTARNKEIKLRLLDKQKVKEESIKWQLINLLIPISLIVIFAFAYNYFRKRKWAMNS
jgi:ABC-2 type transport system permease protein